MQTTALNAPPANCRRSTSPTAKPQRLASGWPAMRCSARRTISCETSMPCTSKPIASKSGVMTAGPQPTSSRRPFAPASMSMTMRFCDLKENCCSRSRTYSSASESNIVRTFAFICGEDAARGMPCAMHGTGRGGGFSRATASAGRTAITGQAAQQIRQESNRLAAVQDQPFPDLHAQAPAKVLEVVDGAMVDVRRLVPLVGQGARHRHAPQRHLQARVPMAEIRKADDYLRTHPQHFLHQELGAMDGLQRLRKDHEVEGTVGEERKAALQVDLQHVDVVRDAIEHRGVVDFHAVARRLALLPQMTQERAVAAAEIQHSRAGRHPVRDGVLVGAYHSSMFPK